MILTGADETRIYVRAADILLTAMMTGMTPALNAVVRVLSPMRHLTDDESHHRRRISRCIDNFYTAATELTSALSAFAPAPPVKS